VWILWLALLGPLKLPCAATAAVTCDITQAMALRESGFSVEDVRQLCGMGDGGSPGKSLPAVRVPAPAASPSTPAKTDGGQGHAERASEARTNVDTQASQPATQDPSAVDTQNDQPKRWPSGSPHLLFFQPKLRVYFDAGHDGKNEVDLFKDGSFAPTIDFLQYYYAWGWGDLGKKSWTWGPAIGFGIAAPTSDAGSSEGSATADGSSGAPVVVPSLGLMASFPLDDAKPHGLAINGEIGWALGLSADEHFSDSTDSAIYVGIQLGWDWARALSGGTKDE